MVYLCCVSLFYLVSICLFTKENTRQSWKMSESRNHFFFELLVLLCCISFQDVSGTQMKLIRDKKGDYFTNPYSTTPSASKFCDLRNATCFNEGRRGNNAQCSHCKCNVVTFKTFNKTSLRCAPIQDFGQGMVAKKALIVKTNTNYFTYFSDSEKKIPKWLRNINGLVVIFFAYCIWHII